MKQKIQLLKEWQTKGEYPPDIPIEMQQHFCPPTYLNVQVLMSDKDGSYKNSYPMTFKADLMDLLNQYQEFQKEKTLKET